MAAHYYEISLAVKSRAAMQFLCHWLARQGLLMIIIVGFALDCPPPVAASMMSVGHIGKHVTRRELTRGDSRLRGALAGILLGVYAERCLGNGGPPPR